VGYINFKSQKLSLRAKRSNRILHFEIASLRSQGHVSHSQNSVSVSVGRDCQTSLNSCFNACFEMFCRNPVKKWQRLPAAATRQDAASTIWGRTEKFSGHCRMEQKKFQHMYQFISRVERGRVPPFSRRFLIDSN